MTAGTEPITPRMPQFRAGDVISNRYEVVAVLGQGGMGCVYEVRDRDLLARGSVALKTIRGDLAGKSEMVARFEREVRHALSVTHPNVCRTYDIGRHGEGPNATLYLTMEFLPGQRLDDWLEKGARTVPESEALPLIRQLAAGLAAIHEQNIVHRDFKPGNVMLVKHGAELRAVITDLGLARATGGQADPTVTHVDAVAGTPAYMAPEQLTGKSPLNCGADVYALGLTMLEILAGTRVPREDSTQTLRRLGVGPQLSNVIAGCLEPDPERRYRTAGEVLRHLDISKDIGKDTSKEPGSLGTTATMTPTAGPRPADRRRWLGIAAIGVVIIAGVVAAIEFTRPKVSNRAIELTAKANDKLSSSSFLDASRILEQVVALAPHYPLAHAMLADAWNELELTGRANREMNKIEAADLRSASSDDRLYIEGVRLTLTGDYAGAVNQFRGYFNKGDETSRPDRAILLGRALEKARLPDEAAKAYASAGKRGAALLSLAVLDSRRQQILQALEGFAEARRQFESFGEHGAVASLQYQLGTAFNRWGKLSDAESALRACLDQARLVGDLYDELRCRQQLATIGLRRAATAGTLDALAGDVSGIIDAAGRPGFQILTARAWLLLAQIHAQRGDYPAADRDFAEASSRAESEDAAQLRASIGIAEASLHLRNHRPGDAEKEVRAALAYYESAGYKKEAGQACIMLSRALRDAGQLDQAKHAILDKAPLFASLSPLEIAQMHEALASIDAEKDDRRSEILQLESAIAAAPDGSNVPLYKVRIAHARLELGMIPEARKILAEVRAQGPLPAAVEDLIRRTEATADLYELQPAAALEDLRPKGRSTAIDPILAGLALIGVNRAADGITSCESARTQWDRPAIRANIELCVAEGLVALHRPSDAVARLAQIDASVRNDPGVAWRTAIIGIRISRMGFAPASAESPEVQIRGAISALKDLWGRDNLARRLLCPDKQRDLRLAGLDKQKL